jgi:hypothetical protein
LLMEESSSSSASLSPCPSLGRRRLLLRINASSSRSSRWSALQNKVDRSCSDSEYTSK